MIDEALADEQYDLAAELANMVYRACVKANGKKFRKQALQRRREVQNLAAGWKKVEEARAKLQTAPDDPQANLTLGKFFCFAQGDWEQGLAHLAKGSDADLKELARKENSSSPTDPRRQVKLGDGWWDLAASRKGEEKAALTIHAGYWYEKALPKMATGLAKSRIEKRLVSIDEKSWAGETQRRMVVQGGNVALASNGTTVSGQFAKRSPSYCLIDGKTKTKRGARNYAGARWPCEWIIKFEKTYRLREIRLRLWDGDKRFYRYAIATSISGGNYVPLVDRSRGEWRSWQVIRFPKPRPVKFVKIFGLYSSADTGFYIVEFEAYCVPPRR